jgi:hypothetical protein
MTKSTKLSSFKYIGETFVGAPKKLVLSFIKFFSSNFRLAGFQIKKERLAFLPPNAVPLLNTSIYPSLLKSPLHIDCVQAQ